MIYHVTGIRADGTRIKRTATNIGEARRYRHWMLTNSHNDPLNIEGRKVVKVYWKKDYRIASLNQVEAAEAVMG